MKAFAIVGLCVAGAILYGIVHDQVTARVCVEYFTVGHPRLIDSEDPTVLGLFWGVVATWWVGAILGIALALAARAGSAPKRSPGSLVRPVAILLGVMAAFALVAGLAGWFAASKGWVFLVGRIAEVLPKDRHVPFLTALWAHSASYGLGFLGGLFLVWRVARSRRRGLRAGPSAAA